MVEVLIAILLLVLVVLVSLNLYIIINGSKDDNQNQDSISAIDKAIDVQQSSIREISKDLQTFQEPIKKLNRYLSGGPLAGKFGEWSLEAIIKDIFNSKHYESNYEVVPGSGKRVEFIIRLPEDKLLPIDAKFPSALFDNYLEASESGDKNIEKKAKDDIRRHLVNNAGDIRDKYIQEGITIDLGVMFIPSEYLMQVIDSIGSIREDLFRDKRVLIMGPNSLAAYLISVHMGFRNLALNERAGEIMQEFGKLKKEFEKFNSSTEDLQKKAEAMLKVVNEHSIRERQMERAIKNMDDLDS